MPEDVGAPEGFLREIGATATEFERGLRLAVPGGVVSPRPGALRVEQGGVTLEVDLTELPERRMGLFRLPVLRARLRFLSGDVPARQSLLARIDRAMQRGGG